MSIHKSTVDSLVQAKWSVSTDVYNSSYFSSVFSSFYPNLKNKPLKSLNRCARTCTFYKNRKYRKKIISDSTVGRPNICFQY
jgi:hypothetical protein